MCMVWVTVVSSCVVALPHPTERASLTPEDNNECQKRWKEE